MLEALRSRDEYKMCSLTSGESIGGIYQTPLCGENLLRTRTAPALRTTKPHLPYFTLRHKSELCIKNNSNSFRPTWLSDGSTIRDEIVKMIASRIASDPQPQPLPAPVLPSGGDDSSDEELGANFGVIGNGAENQLEHPPCFS